MDKLREVIMEIRNGVISLFTKQNEVMKKPGLVPYSGNVKLRATRDKKSGAITKIQRTDIENRDVDIENHKSENTEIR